MGKKNPSQNRHQGILINICLKRKYVSAMLAASRRPERKAPCAVPMYWPALKWKIIKFLTNFNKIEKNNNYLKILENLNKLKKITNIQKF
jgi:hypothetical protein